MWCSGRCSCSQPATIVQTPPSESCCRAATMLSIHSHHPQNQSTSPPLPIHSHCSDNAGFTPTAVCLYPTVKGSKLVTPCCHHGTTARLQACSTAIPGTIEPHPRRCTLQNNVLLHPRALSSVRCSCNGCRPNMSRLLQNIGNVVTIFAARLDSHTPRLSTGTLHLQPPTCTHT